MTDPTTTPPAPTIEDRLAELEKAMSFARAQANADREAIGDLQKTHAQHAQHIATLKGRLDRLPFSA